MAYSAPNSLLFPLYIVQIVIAGHGFAYQFRQWHARLKFTVSEPIKAFDITVCESRKCWHWYILVPDGHTYDPITPTWCVWVCVTYIFALSGTTKHPARRRWDPWIQGIS